MFVITADQRDSRSHGDDVPDALRRLARGDMVRRFERTAGDEVQGLMTEPEAAVDVLLRLVRETTWWVGVGVGDVDHPLPRSVRAARGSAFVLAREAIGRAKSAPGRIAVAGTDAAAALHAESALWLLAALFRRRTSAGWQVTDAMRTAPRQSQVAVQLGVSVQAVSQRLRVAGWQEELRGRALASHLLAAADASGERQAAP